MAMAYWNGMTWGVSRKQIAYLESLTTSFSIETNTNADKEGKSPTEEVANSLIEISLDTTYRVETGTRDVRGMIETWRNLVGKTGPLIIGSSAFGPDKLQLQKVGVSEVQIDATGYIRAVKLSFNFKEYSESDSGVSTTPISTISTPQSINAGTGETVISGVGSAINVGPSPGDKAAMKPVTTKTNGVTKVITNAHSGASVSVK